MPFGDVWCPFQVHVLTKTRDEPCAYKQTFRDGKPVEKAPTPCAGTDGTTITVEDMFFNLKTRRKALSSSTSEQYAAILRVCGAYAIHTAARGVSVSCRKTRGGTDLNTASGGTTAAAIAAVHGAAAASDLAPFHCDATPGPDRPLDFKLDGFVSRRCVQTTRGVHKVDGLQRFTLFINDRLVESLAIKRAVDETYARPRRNLPRSGASAEFAASSAGGRRLPPRDGSRHLAGTRTGPTARRRLSRSPSRTSASACRANTST